MAHTFNPNQSNAQWESFQKNTILASSLGLMLDVSRMSSQPHEIDHYIKANSTLMQQAFEAMKILEQGAIANIDEQRQVGHYWLRAPTLAPTDEIRLAIETTVSRIKQFAADVHSGKTRASQGELFTHILVIGIGGSALGPQFVSHALGGTQERMSIEFFDNTDPDGFDRVLERLSAVLSTTLVLVISKSGGTKETRNGMLEARWAFERKKLDFSNHFVAITSEGSALDQVASKEQWLARFPMFEWVGGRTSQLSAVGLLPAALQGFDIDAMLQGACQADEITRLQDVYRNPAAMMALMWHMATNGRGSKDMVVLPYKDRLELFSRYLQQLIMESLGKEKDMQGQIVNQGLTVYGNKGSTDQHAYVQQLRDGVPNFFTMFIEVLNDRNSSLPNQEVEPNVTSGDYLLGFLLGTRRALFENNRASMTLTLRDVSAFSIGALIAVFERAVGLYASLIGVNAYHQPGVEAGKKAAAEVLTIQNQIVEFLMKHKAQSFDATTIADHLDSDQVETIFKVCMHMSSNPNRPIMWASEPNWNELWASQFKART